MDRVKSFSRRVLEAHKAKFGSDFADNKKALNQIATIRSKGLKNEIAGYITKFIKREIMQAERLARLTAEKEMEAKRAASEDSESADSGTDPATQDPGTDPAPAADPGTDPATQDPGTDGDAPGRD